MSEEKPKKKTVIPGGRKVGEPRSVEVPLGWDKTRRTGKPVPSGHSTPEEVKKAVKKGVNERNE